MLTDEHALSLKLAEGSGPRPLASVNGYKYKKSHRSFVPKLASAVIQKKYDLAKMAMFRCLLNHVKIEIET